MVVQHNLKAMNSNRMLGITQGTLAKSTEKLSSGYKVNRAADDAAGLSISEKMRKQIRGLTQASANAEDGISAVQTAEGALTEVHDMLQRMNELAVKSANGTNSESDRTAIQNEIDQLTTEIDRVSETTKFNETYLLKGDKSVDRQYTYSAKKFAVGQDAAATISGANAMTLTFGAIAANKTKNQEIQDEVNDVLMSLRDSGVKVSSVAKDNGAGATAVTNTVSLTGAAADKYDVTTDTTNKIFTVKDKNGNDLCTLTLGGTLAQNKGDNKSANMVATSITACESTDATAKYYDKDGNHIPENALSNYMTAGTTAGTVVAKAGAPQLYDAVGNTKALKVDDFQSLQDLTAPLAVTLHVGADSTSNNQITMNIDTMSAKGLGVNGLKVDGTDDSNALNAIDTIKEAISKVSAQRSSLGAIQNRLEHTIKNLDNVVENTTAAESQIRDTDMATEMVKYSNNNILAQAGQSMLAQANQSNQGVLSLLG